MTRRFVALLLSIVAAGRAPAAERSLPVDCLPDRVAAWEAAGPSPESRFGAVYLPGVVLGPPGDSVPYQGAVTTASLGFAGRAVLELADAVIEDRPGPDFIVFENAFFRLPLPASSSADYQLYAEPGVVEVSADGVEWSAFPYDAAALQEMADASAGSDDTIDREMHQRLRGLAGITPTFTGNWTLPDDPAVFDPAGQGGVSGAGGDAFDLATVGLGEARFVRVTDADTRVGFAGSAEGFDLDAVVVLHGRPLPPATFDTDGDGLSDAEEQVLYGTSPALADSDGDGLDDGREVASCRDPLSAGVEPWLRREPRLWLRGRSCTEARWTFVGTDTAYDLVRGDLGQLRDLGAFVDLGVVTCLVDDQLNVRWFCDGDALAPGQGFVYLVRRDGDADWGRSSNLTPRGSSAECP